jgi:hypothetical protein
MVPVARIIGQVHMVLENAGSGGIDSVWLLNTHVDVDTYWTV